MTTDFFGDWQELGNMQLTMNQWITFPNATQTDKSTFRLTFSTANFDKIVGFWAWVRVSWPLNNKELSDKIWIRNEPVQMEIPILTDFKNKGITTRNFQAMLDYSLKFRATVPPVFLRIEEFLG